MHNLKCYMILKYSVSYQRRLNYAQYTWLILSHFKTLHSNPQSWQFLSGKSNWTSNLTSTPHSTMLDNRMYWVCTHTFLARDMVRINRVIYTVSLWGVIAEANVNSVTVSFLVPSGPTDDKAKAWLQGLSSICLSFFKVISTFPSLSEVKISSVLTNQGKGQGRLQLRCVWAVFNIWDHVVFFP